jgi:hypothetical protein
MIEPVELTYDLHLLPRGRVAFRRWRFALWHGSHLLAGGWRLNPHHAQQALRGHALHHAHRLHGLHPLRPHPPVPETLWGDRAVAVQSGHLRVILRPRATADATAA